MRVQREVTLPIMQCAKKLNNMFQPGILLTKTTFLQMFVFVRSLCRYLNVIGETIWYNAEEEWKEYTSPGKLKEGEGESF